MSFVSNGYAVDYLLKDQASKMRQIDGLKTSFKNWKKEAAKGTEAAQEIIEGLRKELKENTDLNSATMAQITKSKHDSEKRIAEQDKKIVEQEEKISSLKEIITKLKKELENSKNDVGLLTKIRKEMSDAMKSLFEATDELKKKLSNA